MSHLYLPDAPKHTPVILPDAPTQKPVGVSDIPDAPGHKPIPLKTGTYEEKRLHDERVRRSAYAREMMERIRIVNEINREYARRGSSKRVSLTAEEREFLEKQRRIDSVLGSLSHTQTGKGRHRRITKSKSNSKCVRLY
jgi:hypothetical protein